MHLAPPGRCTRIHRVLIETKLLNEEFLKRRAFLDIRSRHGHVEGSLWSSFPVGRQKSCLHVSDCQHKTTRDDQQQNQRSAIRRQRGALSFAISHQVQNVRVYDPLHSAPAFHLLSAIILRSQGEHRTWLQNPVWHGWIARGVISRVKQEPTRSCPRPETPLPSFLHPSATSCLPSFVCQWRSLGSSSLFFPVPTTTPGRIRTYPRHSESQIQASRCAQDVS